jgi:uncharacterized protein YcaQ
VTAETLRVSREAVRRLAIERQGLVGRPKGRVNADRILDLVREIGCLQIDPISVIAPTHLLVLWSRLGPLDTKVLDRVLWKDRSLFHYWAHAASLVLTEDYPIHAFSMRQGTSLWSPSSQAHIGKWMTANRSMRRSVLAQIRNKGPSRLRDLEVRSAVPWSSTGWTNNQDVQRMIEFLWWEGKVTIAGRDGQQRIWDLMDRFLPDWTPAKALPKKRAVQESAVRAIRALGVATPTHINYHFTRGRYPDLPKALAALEESGRILRTEVTSGDERMKGKWYVHADDADRLLELGDEEPPDVTRLLSPFDNLICDRKRTLALWDFEYTIEIYVPKAKRRYGYYVLPVLHGDRLVGRLDAAIDRKTGVLSVLSVHAERGAPASAGAGIAEQLNDLMVLRGATTIEFATKAPRVWTRSLR